jgi:PP-loop superfamily ATP-utilizing enzyme
LAIEVKKDINRENRFKDHAKLKAFREQLGYRYTLFVDFSVGKDSTGLKEVVFIPS